MTLGFIIIRHVNSKLSDYYWKECYTCIRKFYDNPILIIDDSSNKDYLIENIFLEKCTVIYDTENKGRGELLPYYYFHKLKPFDTAVIIHDSVFIQNKFNFDLEPNENIRFLWRFNHCFNDQIFDYIRDLSNTMPEGNDAFQLYKQIDKWFGAFGAMSVISWSFLDKINKRHNMFSALIPNITSRTHRCAFERVLALISYYNDTNIKTAFFGDIHEYMIWNTQFTTYILGNYSAYPVVKVWTGR